MNEKTTTHYTRYDVLLHTTNVVSQETGLQLKLGNVTLDVTEPTLQQAVQQMHSELDHLAWLIGKGKEKLERLAEAYLVAGEELRKQND